MARNVKVKNTFYHVVLDDPAEGSASSYASSRRRASSAPSRSSSDNDCGQSVTELGASYPSPPYRHLVWVSEDTAESAAGSGAPRCIPDRKQAQVSMLDEIALGGDSSGGSSAHDSGSWNSCAPIVQAVHAETGAPIEELLQAHMEFDLNLLRRDPLSGELLSVGTIAHAAGRCRPCLFSHKSSCNKGVLCTYCHITHRQPKFKRIKPSKRQRAERNAALAAQRADGNSDSEAENQLETAEFPRVEAQETVPAYPLGTKMRL